ncbi:hypothetical protein [[Flexibacter] sp. ATCC 35208]|uniref:hypothetical protein n=1 Tax=[Flexibacter] sp. ATCC 35208 TaxID=1936242 RepID=UPI0009CDA86E|nr:hypothetical protein [[Flexibacter] sp. ATCC 35208]OMP81117.1 hypothetical protein BW716_00585 [[Flexibacter] sp. ATCC 35208]
MEALHRSLDTLMAVCDDLPASTKEITMLYNYGKLIAILQHKEMLPYSTGEEEMESVYVLTRKFGDIAKDIVVSQGEVGLSGFFELENTIERQLNGHLYLYAKQWGLSVKALYYHKIKQYDKAVDFSMECVAMNDYLINIGIHSLFFRSLEQYRNISRSYLRSGDWRTGCKVANDLMKFLFNGVPGSLKGGIYHDPAIWNAIPYAREYYTYETFRAMVSMTIRMAANFPDCPDMYTAIFEGLEINADTIERVIISNWLEVKNSFRKKDYPLFVDNFIEFMNEPASMMFDLLKISLFQDMLVLIQSSDYAKKEALLLKLENHLDEKLHVKENLRKDISATNFALNDFNSHKQPLNA